MGDIMTYVSSVAVVVVLLLFMAMTRKWYGWLTQKENGLFDENRNAKVNELLSLIDLHLNIAVDAYLVEHDILDVLEADLDKLVEAVREKVTTLTGNGVIAYLMSIFIDNWDEWIREVIRAKVQELITSED